MIRSRDFDNSNFIDLEKFLIDNDIKFTAEKYDTKVIYNFKDTFGGTKYYSVQIDDVFSTFEYDDVTTMATILFEQWKPWDKINKKHLFKLILRELKFKYR